MKRASLIAVVVGAACSTAPPLSAHAAASVEGSARALPVASTSAPAAMAMASPAMAAKRPAPARIKRRTASERAARPDDAPFAFRGIPLGITLAALREPAMVRATPHDSELLCETDMAGSDIGMMVKSDASLTIACRWAHRTAQGWAPSRAVVDGAPAAEHVLRFTHATPLDPLRLYEMSFVVDDTTAFDLRDLFASHYGPPHMQGTPSLPLFVWENASSTITICLFPESRRATLTYLLKSAAPGARSKDSTLKVSQFDEG